MKICAVMTPKEAVSVVFEVINTDRLVYMVRDQACEDRGFKGVSWEHPDVVRINEALKVLEDWIKSSADPGRQNPVVKE